MANGERMKQQTCVHPIFTQWEGKRCFLRKKWGFLKVEHRFTGSWWINSMYHGVETTLKQGLGAQNSEKMLWERGRQRMYFQQFSIMPAPPDMLKMPLAVSARSWKAKHYLAQTSETYDTSTHFENHSLQAGLGNSIGKAKYHGQSSCTLGVIRRNTWHPVSFCMFSTDPASQMLSPSSHSRCLMFLFRVLLQLVFPGHTLKWTTPYLSLLHSVHKV